MTAIQNFAFEEHLVRVVEHDGTTWFVGKDVCGSLDIRNHKDALGRLDPDERAEVGIADPSGTKYATIVSEAGVYRLVFTSRKEQAERFKRWLAHEVLPAIRKTGSYSAPADEQPLPTLDNSSVAVWRAKIDLVREARIQFGSARAKLLWGELGLPEVPQLPPLPADNEPQQCLEHLLAWNTDEGTIGELLLAARDGNKTAEKTLISWGIRIGDDTFIVANSLPGILKIYRATNWREPYRQLRRLPGANVKVMKYGKGITARGVELPAYYIDAETVH